MQVHYTITEPVVPQSIRLFGVRKVDGLHRIDPAVGKGGTMYEQTFPGDLEFYHFTKTIYQVPIEMKSVNPPDSPWFLLHINLASVHQNKTVDGEQIEFHKYRPAGILLYGPGLEIDTFFPPGTEAAVCGMRFSRSWLEEYLGEEMRGVALDKPLTYEDLDTDLEGLLMDALEVIDKKMTAHARVLVFLQAFFDKLRKHDPMKQAREIHSMDYKNLLKVSSILRDPLAEEVPTLVELATIAQMSVTKFKMTFKQVFGSAPKQYQNKIRMEYAKEQLRKSRKSPTELSYELGYSHPSNFTAAYKKFYNVLPSNEAG